ncbi:MAG: phosphoribosyltransferase, partial [Verrucomicrobiota bacterium]
HEDLAMGAFASGGIRVLNEDVVTGLRIPRPVIDRVAAKEQRELDRRERLYRGSRPPTKIASRLVILVDDGIATGSTMRAAVIALKQHKPARVIVAVPTAPASSYEEFQGLADEIVVARVPENFYAIGEFYEDFSQTTDEQVQELLAKAAQTCATVSP